MVFAATAMVFAHMFFPGEALGQRIDGANDGLYVAKTVRDKQKMPVTRATDTDDLIWALGNHDYTAPRRMAAEFLGDRGATEAIPALLKALYDPEEVVQKAAAEALTKVGDDRLFEPLMENLKSPRPHVREYSAYVLGQLAKDKDHREIPDVIKALEGLSKDKDPLVRDQVFNALYEIGASSSRSIFIAGLKDSDPAIRRHSANGLGKLKGSGAEDALVDAYAKETNLETKQAISTALGTFGSEKALTALISTMDKQLPSERAMITDRLAESGSQEAVDILCDLIETDNSAVVRTRAAEGLLRAQNPTSIHALSMAIGDKVAAVKIPASTALLKIAETSPDDVERSSITTELIQAMGDTNDVVGDNAAKILVKLGDTKVIPELMLLLDNANPAVIDRATAVLEELTYKPYGTDVAKWKAWYEENYKGGSSKDQSETNGST